MLPGDIEPHTWRLEDLTCVCVIAQNTGLPSLEAFPPRWCFYCEADFIIYLCAKVNPRLGLTYLSFRIPKLGVSPSLSFLKQTTVSASLPASLRSLFSLFPAFASLSFCLSSPLSLLDVQAVAQSLLLLRRGCGCEKKWRTASAEDRQARAPITVTMMRMNRKGTAKAKWDKPETAGGEKNNEEGKEKQVGMRCKKRGRCVKHVCDCEA